MFKNYYCFGSSFIIKRKDRNSGLVDYDLLIPNDLKTVRRNLYSSLYIEESIVEKDIFISKFKESFVRRYSNKIDQLNFVAEQKIKAAEAEATKAVQISREESVSARLLNNKRGYNEDSLGWLEARGVCNKKEHSHSRTVANESNI